MNRGYRLNNLINFSSANFGDMLGMTSGHEVRSAYRTARGLFPEYINPRQALGRKLNKRVSNSMPCGISNHSASFGNEIGKPSNPYSGDLNQGMKGDTYIMNPAPNVGNPYNLIKKGMPTYPTRIRTKTKVKTLTRGSL